MTQQESNAINIARFILVVGILFIHFPISFVAADGINLTESDTPMYNLISSRFFLSDTCLSGLFLLSGYLFFKNIPGEYSEKLYFKKINARLWSICVPYLFWNVFWLVYNLLKTYKLQDTADSDLLEITNISDIIVNYIYYFVIHARVVYILLVIVSFVIIFKISFWAWNSKTLLSLSASSTFLYLTHIFILNVSRHSLAKILVIDSDMDMCIYYLLNSTLCVIICLGSFFLLKRLKANLLLKVLTGGRA